jgi:ABC-2 type transport system ATP-binding protein
MSGLIQVDQLTKNYRVYKKEPGFWGAVKGLWHRRYDETAAVNQISFSIEEGEMVGFLGPNGAGKTTTLKMLAGLIYPTSGRAQVLGYTPWQRANAFKRQFALVLGQKNQLWWDVPAAESLELNRVIYGLEKVAAQRVIDELSDLLEVRDKLQVMVRELSLGERMKMELIAALLHEPKVLFLDEPTIGLDVISQKKVREFLRDYTKRKKITTLLTSHYMQDIEELCPRVIIVDRGLLFFDGALQQILDRFSAFKLMTLTRRGGTENLLVPEGLEVVAREGDQIKLKVERAQIAPISQHLLSAWQPDDISIEEVPIEDIIRQVFAERR